MGGIKNKRRNTGGHLQGSSEKQGLKGQMALAKGPIHALLIHFNSSSPKLEYQPAMNINGYLSRFKMICETLGIGD